MLIKRTLFILCIATAFISSSFKWFEYGKIDAAFLTDMISAKYPKRNFESYIYVGVKLQKLYLVKNNQIVKTYNVSTSKNGAGTKAGSEMTPIGLHKIKRKYGDGVPLGGIMKRKEYTGEIAEIESQPIATGKDDITTRVITIAGLEEGVNKGGELDSYDRKIYIHGTPEEGLIGKPASHGCIRLKNEDVVDLFNRVTSGLYVVIFNN